MLQVRDGNASAFEELVRKHQQRLLNVLSHLAPSKEQAEDLVQEVFLRVYRSRMRYSPTAKFSTWLYTIASNVASNARRSRARRKEVNVQPTGNDSTAFSLAHIAKAASGLMPTRQLASSEIGEVVRAAIESLNERQRMALLLSKFENMSYADIGVAMELNIPAVKSLLSRARENLREILEPYMAAGERSHE
ncbi:MAG: sigma-70 family RNA polymerase sigma factor [bacterium]|nr:sigma-70 family RNA polymerase sigma factor [bacterium]